jgi:hypothetical protein
MTATTTQLTAAELIALLETPSADGSAVGIDPTDAVAIAGTGNSYVEVVTDTEVPVVDASSGIHQPTLLDLQADGSTVDFSTLTSIKTVIQDDAITGSGGTTYINGVAGATYKIYDGDLADTGQLQVIGPAFHTNISDGSGNFDVYAGPTNQDSVTDTDTVGNLTVVMGAGSSDQVTFDGVNLTASINGNAAVVNDDGTGTGTINVEGTGVPSTGGYVFDDTVNIGANVTGATITGTYADEMYVNDDMNAGTLTTNIGNTIQATQGDVIDVNGNGNLKATFGDVQYSEVIENGNGNVTVTFNDGSESSNDVVKDYGTGSLTVTFGEGYSDLLDDSATGPLTATFGDGTGDVAYISNAATTAKITMGNGNDDNIIDNTNDSITGSITATLGNGSGDEVLNYSGDTINATLGSGAYDTVNQNGDGNTTAIFGDGSNDSVIDNGNGALKVAFGGGSSDLVDLNGTGNSIVTFGSATDPAGVDDLVNIGINSAGGTTNTDTITFNDPVGVMSEAVDVYAGSEAVKATFGDGSYDNVLDNGGGTLNAMFGFGLNDTVNQNGNGNTTVVFGDTTDNGPTAHDIMTDNGSGTLSVTYGANSADTLTDNGGGNATVVFGDGASDLLNDNQPAGAHMNAAFGNGSTDIVQDAGDGNLTVTFGAGVSDVLYDNSPTGNVTATFNDVSGGSNDAVDIGTAGTINPAGNATITMGDGSFDSVVDYTSGTLHATLGDGDNDSVSLGRDSTGDGSGSAIIAMGDGNNDVLSMSGAGNVTATLGDGNSDQVYNNQGGTVHATLGDGAGDSVFDYSTGGASTYTFGNGDVDTLNLTSYSTENVTVSFGSGNSDVVDYDSNGNITVTFLIGGSGDVVNDSGFGTLHVDDSSNGLVINDFANTGGAGGAGNIVVDGYGTLVNDFASLNVVADGNGDIVQMDTTVSGQTIPIVNDQTASGGTGGQLTVYGGDGLGDVIKGSTGGYDSLYGGIGDDQTIIAEGTYDNLTGGSGGSGGGVGDILESAFGYTTFNDNTGTNLTMKQTAAVVGDVFNLFQGNSDAVSATYGNAIINVGNIAMNASIKGAATDTLTFQDSFADANISTKGGVTTISFADTATVVHVTGIAQATFTDGVHAI